MLSPEARRSPVPSSWKKNVLLDRTATSIPTLKCKLSSSASGYGIAKGVHLGDIQNLSVAPALAKLLGLSFPQAKGPVPRQLFSHAD